MSNNKSFVILRDDTRIERLRKLGQIISLVGFLALLAGLILGLTGNENAAIYQLAGLLFGWLFSQFGLFLAHRYIRTPRPDQRLDEALSKVVKGGRLYHFALPAPHVLLSPEGVIVFCPKYQIGTIRADGENWKQKGNTFRRWFGQEALGNPSREVQLMASRLANYIRKEVPQMAEQELPISMLIVFTTKEIKELDVKNSTIPAMHYTKLRGYLKQQAGGQKLPAASYQALQQAFDKAAGNIVPQAG